MSDVNKSYDELYYQIVEEGKKLGLKLPEYADENGNKKKGSSQLMVVNELAKTYNERMQNSEENRIKEKELDIKKAMQEEENELKRQELSIRKVDQSIKKAEEANKTFDIIMRSIVGIASVKITKDIWVKVMHLEGLGHMITSTTGKNLLGSLKIFKK